jgi:hypothetical protein
VPAGHVCPPPINCGTDQTGTAPMTPAQVAAYNAIVCPSGYTKAGGGYLLGLSTSYVPNANDMCLTGPTGVALRNMSDPIVASLVASQTSQQTTSYIMMAGGAGLVLFGDGIVLKLAGVALAAFGFLKGAFIGGM